MKQRRRTFAFALVFKRSEWDAMIAGPGVDAQYYSYANFRKAASKYPEFFGGKRNDARREIAAFLANLYQETRFSYKHEIRCHGADPPCNDYGNTQWGSRHNLLAVPGCTRAEWDCRYFGRGPMQLTWYLNYLDTSRAIFGDDRLVREPWQVAEDPVVGWTTALHFWMTNRGREPLLTAHQAMRIPGGNFGKTISVINGNQECGAAWDARAQTRVDKYLDYCRILGVQPGDLLRC
jgi:chitinase